ncbi:MAG: hypothetical protein JOZ20_00425 [Sphingomonas sp.]|nr:hypothetical protein [Sphingomonas sp.]MBW0008466.1 hypothetical protein [Sphingomonas sp.]
MSKGPNIMLLFLPLIMVAADAPAVAAQPHSIGGTFHSKKSMAQLEKCLTDRLSQLGQVTSVPIENAKTLMLSTSDEPPMMIDIAPPDVKVTTKFAIGTEPLVKGCL